MQTFGCRKAGRSSPPVTKPPSELFSLNFPSSTPRKTDSIHTEINEEEDEEPPNRHSPTEPEHTGLQDQNALCCKQEQKGRKQQQHQRQQQTNKHPSYLLTDSHLTNLLRRFFTTEKWHKIKTSFRTETSKPVRFSTGVPVLHRRSVLRHSAFVNILHFPACPCSFTHKDILPLHWRGWRDEEVKASPTRTRVFLKTAFLHLRFLRKISVHIKMQK